MEHCISDHRCRLLWASSSQWAFCLYWNVHRAIMKCKGPGHFKFFPQNDCASCSPPACPCLKAQPGTQPLSLLAWGAQRPGLSPLLQPLSQKPVGFLFSVRPQLLVLGLTFALKCLLLIEHHVANVSGNSVVRCQSQIDPGAQRCWRDCCSSNSGRGAPLLRGGHHLQKKKSKPPWSKADNASLIPS